jgi:hypothetical protein
MWPSPSKSTAEPVDAAGHELPQADGAGERALDRRGRHLLGVCQPQELAQFVAEEGTAVLAAGGEVQAQRGQGIEHAEVAGHAAVEGLHADDAHHHAGGHAVAGFGFVQPALVGGPEGGAGLHPCRLDEAGPVGGPVLGRAGRRRHDQPRHRRLVAGLRQLRPHPVGCQAVPFGQLVGQGHGVFATAVSGGIWRAVGPRRLRHLGAAHLAAPGRCRLRLRGGFGRLARLGRLGPHRGRRHRLRGRRLGPGQGPGDDQHAGCGTPGNRGGVGAGRHGRDYPGVALRSRAASADSRAHHWRSGRRAGAPGA